MNIGKEKVALLAFSEDFPEHMTFQPHFVMTQIRLHACLNV